MFTCESNKPYVFYRGQDYIILAKDETGEFGGVRTLTFKNEENECIIGSYVTKEMNGYSEWCQIDEDYIMIFSKTAYVKTPTLKTIFDIKAKKTCQEKPKILSKK